MIQLRPFQEIAKRKVYEAWKIYNNVLLQLPTGAGKTVIAADIIREHAGPTVAIAHRQEIVSQISMAFARNNLRHRVIGPEAIVHACRNQHLSELGKNYIDGTSSLAVAGVDTLIRATPAPWFNSVTLVFQDESHHQLKDNKWGKAYKMFPNARLLGVTATPCRADGKGLGLHHDGFFETLITGPTGRELIDAGWLTDYKIYCPPSDLILNGVPISANGDYSPPKLSTAVHKSHIVGDVVKHYLKWAEGKRGIAFSVDVKAAVEQAAAFRAAGVKAEVVSAKTPDSLRASLLRQFRNGSIHILCNVDLFGEGMDVPAVEVVIMARPTASYVLYAQKFGRALRILEGKSHAIIIDHVGNVQRHGLPDGYKVWSLDRRDRKSNNTKSEIPIKTCAACLAAYQALSAACPYCGYRHVPSNRSSPEFVDGDLFELSPEALSHLRGNINRPIAFPIGASREVVGYLKKVQRERSEALAELQSTMAQWAGKYSQATDETTVRELQKRFYFTFGSDVLSAQGMNKADTLKLIERIKNEQ